MNNGCFCKDKARTAAIVVAALGVFLTLYVALRLVQQYTAAPVVGAERIALRKKSLVEINAANAELLNSYAEIDKAKGVWRVPIGRALELTAVEWQHPAAARSNLITRAEMASAPPPKAPEKPSEFE